MGGFKPPVVKEFFMNLILSVNSNLYSVRNSQEGEFKTHAAIADAMEEFKIQSENNQERIKKGLKPMPYSVVIKDEYGKDFVTIKETKNLAEIRKEYHKKLETYSFENKEKNLLEAMNEIGNSDKSEFSFKEELKNTLNSSLFVNDVELTPGQEKILDYFGDPNGLFNTINFKEDISAKCIKDLIDMPNPKTGKPPKTFEQLVSNIISINSIFKENPNKDNYIEIARNYINLRYKSFIPEKYRYDFESRGGLTKLINTSELLKEQKNKLNNLDFEVSSKNFKSLFQSFSQLEQFKNKPGELAKYLFQRVSKENKEEFLEWMKASGCKDNVSTMKVLTKWSNEAENKKMNNSLSKNKNDNDPEM